MGGSDDSQRLRRQKVSWHGCDDSFSNDSSPRQSIKSSAERIKRPKVLSRKPESALYNWTKCLLLVIFATAAAIAIMELSVPSDERKGFSPLRKMTRKSEQQGEARFHLESKQFVKQIELAERKDRETTLTLHLTSKQFVKQIELAEKKDSETTLTPRPIIKANEINLNDLPNSRDTDDREPILRILRQAGVDTSTLDQATYDKLPTWSKIQRLYGTEPKIHGLETCAAFRNATDPTFRFLAIAGTFNSGTNLLAQLLGQNCQIKERMDKYGEESKGMRWQVPWGKHMPAKYRLQHVTVSNTDVPVNTTLPLITIRDPYQWMQSMCRHSYTVRRFNDEKTCPHLASPSRRDDWKEGTLASSLQSQDLVPAHVFYDNAVNEHDTLAHLWNDWYAQYMSADYPRVFVRFEDLLFYGQQVTETLCQCGGGVPRFKKFYHVQESAKLGFEHVVGDQGKTNLLDAIILYGTDRHRLDYLTTADLELARQLFDPNLMKMFNYEHPRTS